MLNQYTVWIEIERGKGGEDDGREGKETKRKEGNLYIMSGDGVRVVENY